MHTYTARRNQQVNRRYIKITYLLAAPEPAQGKRLLNGTHITVSGSATSTP